MNVAIKSQRKRRSKEGWLRGLKHRTANAAIVKTIRGFESLTFRKAKDPGRSVSETAGTNHREGGSREVAPAQEDERACKKGGWVRPRSGGVVSKQASDGKRQAARTKDSNAAITVSGSDGPKPVETQRGVKQLITKHYYYEGFF